MDAGEAIRRAAGRMAESLLAPPARRQALRDADEVVRLSAARERVETERALLEADRALLEAEMQARHGLALVALHLKADLAGAAAAALEAEAELRFLAVIHGLPPDQASMVVEKEREKERLLLARAILRNARFHLPEHGGTELPAGPSPDGGMGEPSVQADFTDRQIESLALRPVARFAALGPAEAERAWEAWRAELHRRFPPLAAQEIEQRADELRGLSR